MPKCFEVSSFDNVYIEIYTMGFPIEGESILTVLRDNDKILFSFLIDSYKSGDVIPALEIAKNIHLEQLDYFFWTHPDHDHSLGIDEVLMTLDKEYRTRIILPEGMNKDLPLAQSARSSIEYINKHYNSGQKYHSVSLLGVDDLCGLPTWSINFKEQCSEFELPCRFTILAPHSSLIQRLEFTDSPSFNDFSLVLSMSWNSCTFLYTGDISNRGIRILHDNQECEKYLKNILYVKIPHHGSKSSNNLINYLSFLGTGEERAVSTLKKSNNIPDNNVLLSYQKKINQNNVIVVGDRGTNADICSLKYKLTDSQCLLQNIIL